MGYIASDPPSWCRCRTFLNEESSWLTPISYVQHPFSVIRSAGERRSNYLNPVRRDVVNTGLDGSNVTIRFTTDNPGPWLLHWYVSQAKIRDGSRLTFALHASHIDFHYAKYVSSFVEVLIRPLTRRHALLLAVWQSCLRKTQGPSVTKGFKNQHQVRPHHRMCGDALPTLYRCLERALSYLRGSHHHTDFRSTSEQGSQPYSTHART